MTRIECNRFKLVSSCAEECGYYNQEGGECTASYNQLLEINKKRTYFCLGKDKKLHKMKDQQIIRLLEIHDWTLADRIEWIRTQMVFIYEEDASEEKTVEQIQEKFEEILKETEFKREKFWEKFTQWFNKK